MGSRRIQQIVPGEAVEEAHITTTSSAATAKAATVPTEAVAEADRRAVVMAVSEVAAAAVMMVIPVYIYNNEELHDLVIFGEYIPLVRWLPFLSWFTPIQGGFTPGDKPVPFRMDNLAVETSVLICSEDVFPGMGRTATAEETGQNVGTRRRDVGH